MTKKEMIKKIEETENYLWDMLSVVEGIYQDAEKNGDDEQKEWALKQQERYLSKWTTIRQLMVDLGLWED